MNQEFEPSGDESFTWALLVAPLCDRFNSMLESNPLDSGLLSTFDHRKVIGTNFFNIQEADWQDPQRLIFLAIQLLLLAAFANVYYFLIKPRWAKDQNIRVFDEESYFVSDQLKTHSN